MKYEIVTLKEKIAVGVSARTSNASPDMGAAIGGLWNRLFKEGVYASIFEEYQDDSMDNGEIHIYVGLKHNTITI
jgi:predicted transcriptional regulator YdeE